MTVWSFVRRLPRRFAAADVNDDGLHNITDPIALLHHLFLGGEAPSEPFADCGSDPTPDDLTCDSHEPCE